MYAIYIHQQNRNHCNSHGIESQIKDTFTYHISLSLIITIRNSVIKYYNIIENFQYQVYWHFTLYLKQISRKNKVLIKNFNDRKTAINDG